MDYVPRFCSGLNLRGDVRLKTIEILREASEEELTIGQEPTGLTQQQYISLQFFAVPEEHKVK